AQPILEPPRAMTCRTTSPFTLHSSLSVVAIMRVQTFEFFCTHPDGSASSFSLAISATRRTPSLCNLKVTDRVGTPSGKLKTDPVAAANSAALSLGITKPPFGSSDAPSRIAATLSSSGTLNAEYVHPCSLFFQEACSEVPLPKRQTRQPPFGS